ncbi:MAG: hypothetical protein ABIE68_04830 [bacterium]
MPKKKKTTGNDFKAMFAEFGSAIAEIFDDPKLKEKAKALGKATEASAKAFAKRFQDEDVQNKFNKAGKSAKKVGRKVAEEGKKFGRQMETVGKKVGKDIEKQYKAFKAKQRNKKKKPAKRRAVKKRKPAKKKTARKTAKRKTTKQNK